MGWETRQRGGRYYYRKERAGQRVRSVYVGGGDTARLLSTLDGLDRAEAEARREGERAERRRGAAEDRAFDELARQVEAVASAHLLARGFHTHKRQWRLIRGGKK